MLPKFFPNLIQDYVKLLESKEFYDVEIQVGKGHNVRIFHTHKSILCSRSAYFKQTLTSIEKNNVIILPNISPETFQIILKYIYSGVLLLNENNSWDVLKVLMAANSLLLQELVSYLQKYLTEDRSKWLEQNFDLIYRTSSRYNLLELQQSCMDLMVKSPQKIFKSFDITSLSENILIELIKRDDLQMEEIEVWNHVLQWGLAQNPGLGQDPVRWTDNDVKLMENTLKNCLSYIRFFNLSPKEFSEKVRPYKKLLNRQIYDDLLNSYLDPNREPSDNFMPPRNIKMDGIIDSEIINLNIVSIISRQIDKMNVDNKYANFRELYLPYKFELLLRGSRDGFSPKTFHELCDDKPNTISFVKIKDTEEIIGGYNPLVWKSLDKFGGSTDSFIFSFKKANNFKDVMISNVKDVGFALRFHPKGGPYFGQDLVIHSSDELTDFDKSYYMHKHYEKKIRDIEGKFSIEDYEVFQISSSELGKEINKNDKDTVEILRELAENGDVEAKYNLAYRYNEGLEAEVDNPKAIKVYKKLAEKGDVDSMFNLAYCYNKKGSGSEINTAKTFELCKKLAKKGNSTAQNNLGTLYLEGEGTRRSMSKAIYWFQKASENGNSLAQDNLGICYELGIGVDKDENKAFEFYKQSVENGLMNAKFHLGYCYVNGIGTEIDKNKGMELYNNAAKEGGDTKELGEVCYWYQKAAGNDSKMALFKLGEFYELGKSVNKNGFRAFDYYKRSSEKGYIIGTYKLAHFYEHGIGTYSNKEKAFSLYKTAAEGGYSVAQRILATLYEQGEGTEQDMEKAIYWYKEAVKNGYLKAEENLNELILKNNYSFF